MKSLALKKTMIPSRVFFFYSHQFCNDKNLAKFSKILKNIIQIRKKFQNFFVEQNKQNLFPPPNLEYTTTQCPSHRTFTSNKMDESHSKNRIIIWEFHWIQKEVYLVPGFARYKKECGIYLFIYFPYSFWNPQKHALK